MLHHEHISDNISRTLGDFRGLLSLGLSPGPVTFRPLAVLVLARKFESAAAARRGPAWLPSPAAPAVGHDAQVRDQAVRAAEAQPRLGR